MMLHYRMRNVVIMELFLPLHGEEGQNIHTKIFYISIHHRDMELTKDRLYTYCKYHSVDGILVFFAQQTCCNKQRNKIHLICENIIMR